MADIEEKTEETPIIEDKTEEVVEETTEDKPVVEEEPVIDVDKLDIKTRVKEEEAKIDYGEDIDETDAKVFGSIVEKQTAGIKKQLQEAQDKMEVDSFIQEKPEFAKYKPVIMKYLQHPVYNKIPVENIASMVAAKDLMAIGAKKEREAQAKADSTKTGGSSSRTTESGATDWSKAPKEAFEEQRRRIMERH